MGTAATVSHEVKNEKPVIALSAAAPIHVKRIYHVLVNEGFQGVGGGREPSVSPFDGNT